MSKQRIDYTHVTAILTHAEIVDIGTTLIRGRTVVARGGPFGPTTIHFSTGKLECALRRCGDVYVIAGSQTSAREWDDWWVSQLKRGHVIFGPDRIDAAQLSIVEMKTFPWITLFRKTGIKSAPRNEGEARHILRTSSNFILGESLHPNP